MQAMLHFPLELPSISSKVETPSSDQVRLVTKRPDAELLVPTASISPCYCCCRCCCRCFLRGGICSHVCCKKSNRVSPARPRLNADGEMLFGIEIVSERRSSSKFIRVFSESYSEPPRATLFFIHGIGGSCKIWQKQLHFFLEKGFQVIAPDLLGHGKSTKSDCREDYEFSNLRLDMLHVFDKFCSRKQTFIIGHSYGASLAVYVAQKRRGRCERLVLISGGSPTPLNPQACGLFSLPTWLLHCLRPYIRRTFLRKAFQSASFGRKWLDVSFRVSMSVLRHVMNGQVWPDGDRQFHAQIQIPTLILHGSHDQLISLREEEAMAEAVENSRLVNLPDCSHMPMLEQPDLLNEELLSFFTASSA